MTTPVTLTIPAERWESLGQDIHRGIFLLNRLREAGVPVVGALWPTSVMAGALVHVVAGDQLMWMWTP